MVKSTVASPFAGTVTVLEDAVRVSPLEHCVALPSGSRVSPSTQVPPVVKEYSLSPLFSSFTVNVLAPRTSRRGTFGTPSTVANTLVSSAALVSTRPAPI